MEEIIIREIKQNELGKLENMLYEAIYQPDEKNVIPREVTRLPEISVHIDNFGEKKNDYCMVADLNGKIVGAVWTRILSGNIKGLDMLITKHLNLRFHYTKNIAIKASEHS